MEAYSHSYLNFILGDEIFHCTTNGITFFVDDFYRLFEQAGLPNIIDLNIQARGGNFMVIGGLVI